MRVIIAGGGTGGHIIPAFAIARALESDHAAKLLFIGTSRGLESKLVPQAGYELKLVEVGALKGVSVARRARTLFDLPRAVWRAGNIIKEFRPDVVIGVGGYASGPAMMAAILRGVPTLAFEANAVPGFANRMVAKFVSAAAVHFEETAKYFRNVKVTGVPVRDEFFRVESKQSGNVPMLLVTGGSQGARALNRAFAAAAPELLKRVPTLRIAHQTGERDLAEIKAAYEHAGVEAEISAFIADMPSAFARADLLLCRSGASTVAEVAAAGKAAIFVPFPFATDNHQKRNAEALTTKGAALLIPESELTPERIANELSPLLSNPTRREGISKAAQSFSHPKAAREIAEMSAGLSKMKREPGLAIVLLQALSCVLGAIIGFNVGWRLEGTEFSGGWLTGRLLDLNFVGFLMFLPPLFFIFFFRRVSAVITMVAALLSLPLYVYGISPGLFRKIFQGVEFSMPTPFFSWNPVAIAGVLICLVAAASSLFSFRRRN